MSFEDILQRGEREIGQILHRHQNPAGQDAPDQAIPAAPTTLTDQTTQETHMSKLQTAQAALADIAGNPLIDAIAEAGIGLACGPQEVNVVLNVIRAIENGPGAHQQAAAATTATDDTSGLLEQHTAGAQPLGATFTANTPAQA